MPSPQTPELPPLPPMDEVLALAAAIEDRLNFVLQGPAYVARVGQQCAVVLRAFAAHSYARAASKQAGDAPTWRPIDSAPKDGSEILVWREDCGILLARWTCCDEFVTDRERDELDEETLFQHDWFYADFVSGGRLEGSEVPTHWMGLPADPAPPADVPTLKD